MESKLAGLQRHPLKTTPAASCSWRSLRRKLEIPLFLPVCIARDHYTLWTEDRMQQLISAAKKRNIAFEINNMAHTPHEKFIRMAKEQGLKFTFGSDSRNNNAGRLAYCRRIAAKCGLKPDDFYIPAHKTA